MSADLVVGIDVGSTATKAVVCDSDGTIVSRGSTPTRIERPQPGWAEIDYTRCWEAAVTACRAALAGVPGSAPAKRIAGIGLTSLAPSVAPLAPDGTPLQAGIIYEDRRSVPQVARILACESQPALVQRTGIRIESGSTTVSSMLWLVEERPELVAECAYFGSLTTYLAHRLTGEFGTDWAHAQLTGLFALDDPPRWLQDWCRRLGIPSEKLPPHMPSQAMIGELNGAAAELLGVPAGTPVAMGGADAQAAAVSAGLATPQAGLLSLGTTSVLTVCIEESLAEPRFYTRRHVLPERYLHVAPTLIGGTTLRWAAALLGVESVAALVALAATSEPGAGGAIFLPYLMGERAPLWDREARGVFYGLHASTGRPETGRAVLEGVSCALRTVLTEMEAHLGGSVCPLAVTGGAAFPSFLQTLANVLQRPLMVIEGGDGAAQGAALLAWVAAEERDVAWLADWQPQVRETIAPDGGTCELYERKFAEFTDLYGTLKPIFSGQRGV